MTEFHERVARLPEALRAQFRRGLEADGSAGADDEGADGLTAEDSSPATVEQEQLWVLDNATPGGLRHNVGFALTLRGPLDVERLHRALAAVLRRHETLRTTFSSVDGSLVATVAPVVVVDLGLVPLDAATRAAREIQAECLIAELAAAHFDLGTGPLFRTRLIRMEASEHVFVWVAHHIVWDALSSSRFVQELAEELGRRRAGAAPALRPLGSQYSVYARRQRRFLATGQAGAHREFWRRRVHGVPPLEFPTDRPRPRVFEAVGTLVSRDIPSAVVAALTRLAGRARASLYMMMLAAFEILLWRYSGQERFAVGVPYAGRDAEGDDLIGYFVKMLVVPADLSGNLTFAELVQDVRGTLLEAFDHAELPFATIVEAVNPPRDPSRHPLFQVELTLVPPIPVDGLFAGLDAELRPLHDGGSRFDFSLVLRPDAAGLRASIEYNTALFEDSTPARFLEDFEVLVREIVAAPDRRISDLACVSSRARAWLLVSGSGVTERFAHRTVVDMLDERLGSGGDHLAVVCGTESLSYRELDDRTRRLARVLAGRGVAPETRVAVCLPRSLDLVVAILGVLRAGGAYVPLDPMHPDERLRYVVGDAGAIAVLTRAEYRGRFTPERPIWTMPALLETATGVAGPARRVRPVAGNLAYLIYTSGTSGTPKGVAVEHRAVANYGQAIAAHYGVRADDRVLQFFSASFDTSVQELFGALAAGATLVVATDDHRYDPRQLVTLMAHQRITVAELPAAVLPLMEPKALPDLRVLSTGGEPCSREVVNRWRAPGRRIFNGYGPTEATVAVTQMEFVAPLRATPPIGRPMVNHQALILGQAMELLPRGAVGELFIGGVGLARGYEQRPDLTAERFVPDPYGRHPGGRLYATGDLARWNAEGQLEFLGRRDTQVKIRGYRVELGEIEAILEAYPAIEQAVVVLRGEGAENRELVAYVRARHDVVLVGDELGAYLTARLPAYMVPAGIVTISAFPLTTSGKIDRARLPLPTPETLLTRATVHTPQDSIEEEIADRVFRPILKAERVGTRTSFFEVGGNSLQAAQVVARVRDLFAVKISIADFFGAPSVVGLAALVRDQMGKGGPAATEDRRLPALGAHPPPSPHAEAGRALPVLHSQRRLWAYQRANPGRCVAHLPIVWRLRGALDRAALAQALDRLAQRHDALRMGFEESGGRVVQTVGPPTTVPLAVEPLPRGPADSEAHLWAAVSAEVERPFDLARAPLLRAKLLELGPSDHVLVLTAHHLVFDGWSSGIVQRELMAAYDERADGRAGDPIETPEPFARYVLESLDRLRAPEGQACLDYWARQLRGTRPLVLPADHPRETARGFRHGSAPFVIDATLTGDLQRLGARHGVSLFMTLAAGFALFLARLGGCQDVVLGTPFAGRTQTKFEGTVGFFSDCLPLRVRVGGISTYRDLLGRVREAAGGAYANAGVPIEALLDAASTAVAPYQVVFALQNTPRAPLRMAGVDVRPGRHEGGSPVLPILEFYNPPGGILDLSLAMELEEDRLVGLLEYNAALYTPATIAAWTARIIRLYTAVVDHAESVLDTLWAAPAASLSGAGR